MHPLYPCKSPSLPIKPPNFPRAGLSSQSASTGGRQGSRGEAAVESSPSGMGTLLKKRKIFQVTLISSKQSSKCLEVHRIESLCKQHHGCSTKQKTLHFSGDREAGAAIQEEAMPYHLSASSCLHQALASFAFPGSFTAHSWFREQLQGKHQSFGSAQGWVRLDLDGALVPFDFGHGSLPLCSFFSLKQQPLSVSWCLLV